MMVSYFSRRVSANFPGPRGLMFRWLAVAQVGQNVCHGMDGKDALEAVVGRMVRHAEAN